MSVAGQRAGLAGERSGLFFEIIRIVREMREASDGRFPAFVVLENVPGLLSSNRGRDYAVVLRELANVGALDIGWSVLDAQYWGVAQRRRRLFVVADFRGQRASQILALADGLRGDSPPSRTAGQDTATSTTFGVDVSGTLNDWRQDLDGHGANDVGSVAGTVSSKWAKGTGGPSGDETQNLVAHTLSSEGADASDDGTGRGTPLVAFNWQSGGDTRLGISAERVTALGTSQTPAIAFSGKDYGGDAGEIAPTLRAMPHDTTWANGGGQVAVAFDERNITSAANRTRVAPGLPVPTLHGAPGMSVASQMQVRRLTPRECERLQGFPDDWTLVEFGRSRLVNRSRRDGSLHRAPVMMSDSARYRMLGNAVAVPVVEWLLRRIAAYSPDA